MPTLFDNILMLTRRRRPPDVRTCMVCAKPIGSSDASIRLRGLHVHRRCATYRSRREHSLGAPR